MTREKILVVDDEPDVLDLCKQILASNGYQVQGARGGYQAIERVRYEPFDLLLVDINMPGMNGMETFQAIKEFDPDIIGVIITGYASIETAIEAVKMGFEGFVTKPFTPHELNAAVTKTLDRARLERDNARLRTLIPLFELSDAFMTTIDLDELLDQVVHTAQRETRADRVSLMLLDEITGELTIEATAGLHLDALAETKEKAGEGIAGWVATQGEPLLLDDESPLDPRIREAMKSDEVSSALCVPLKVTEDRVIGVLNLSKLGGTPFTQTDLELVSILCGQAAIAIENARLYKEAQYRLAELARSNALIAALARVAARVEATRDPDQVLEALGGELKRLGMTCLVALLEPDRQALVIRYSSLESEAIALAGKLTGLKIRGSRVPRERMPVWTELVEQKSAVFLPDVISQAVAMLSNIPKPVVERAIRLNRINPEAKVIDLPLVVEGQVIGVLVMWGEDLQEGDIPPLSVFAGQVAIAIENAQLYKASQRELTERKQAEEELRRSLKKLRRSFEGTVSALVSAIEMRDPYTAGHQRQVAQLACAIAKEMGLSEEQIEGIRMAGLVHDIGKINVPAEILSKPGRLNDLEFGLIRTHSQVGHNILNGTIEFPWPVAQIVLQHHERMNGSGYPQGLSGEDILLEARILAVADVVEAMSSQRPYRPPRGIDKALEEISQNRGILYDPEVVDACLKLFTEKGFEFKQSETS